MHITIPIPPNLSWV